MNKMMKNTFSLRKVIGVGLSLLFLLTLTSAVKWANYRKSFVLTEVDISGYNILEKDGILLFTAAHVGQGGTDHINNRPKEYWEHKFKEKGLIRCHTLEAQLERYVKGDQHMMWFTINQMIFYKIDESIIESNAGSLVGPPQI